MNFSTIDYVVKGKTQTKNSTNLLQETKCFKSPNV